MYYRDFYGRLNCLIVRGRGFGPASFGDFEMIPRSGVWTRQSTDSEILSLFVDESAASEVAAAADGILEGTHQAKILKNGTGDYTITLNRPSRRDIQVLGIIPMTVDMGFAVTEKDESSVRVVFEVGGTDTNTDFFITLLAFYSPTQR